MIAVQTFDPWLVADALHPFVVAGSSIATSSLLILPAIGKNIGATTNQASENRYLLFWRERVWNGRRWFGFLQLFFECCEALYFLLKFSQSCIDGGDITKLFSAGVLLRHALAVV